MHRLQNVQQQFLKSVLDEVIHVGNCERLERICTLLEFRTSGVLMCLQGLGERRVYISRKCTAIVHFGGSQDPHSHESIYGIYGRGHHGTLNSCNGKKESLQMRSLQVHVVPASSCSSHTAIQFCPQYLSAQVVNCSNREGAH